MSDATPDSATPGTPPRWVQPVLLLNLVMGALFWFFFLTDYSLAGSMADVVYPPVVGLVGFVSMAVLGTTEMLREKPKRFFALVPSLIGGGLSVVLALAMFVPPFTLGALFYVDELLNEQVIQRAASPNGLRTATVTFRGVGAYSGGNGRVSVLVSSRLFPLVEREVYYNGASDAGEDTTEYVRWTDNRSLEIVGEPDEKAATVPLGLLPF